MGRCPGLCYFAPLGGKDVAPGFSPARAALKDGATLAGADRKCGGLRYQLRHFNGSQRDARGAYISRYVCATRGLTAAGATVPGESGGVLIGRFVARSTDVALSITRLVPMEVVERFLSARRHRSPVTLMRIVAVVNVAVEASGSMEPWARPDE
jgi:hypothetical protein